MSTGLRGKLSAIKESSISSVNALKALPSSLKAIQFPQHPSIEAYDDPVSDIKTLELGDLATEYLQHYASNKKACGYDFRNSLKGWSLLHRTYFKYRGLPRSLATVRSLSQDHCVEQPPRSCEKCVVLGSF